MLNQRFLRYDGPIESMGDLYARIPSTSHICLPCYLDYLWIHENVCSAPVAGLPLTTWDFHIDASGDCDAAPVSRLSLQDTVESRIERDRLEQAIRQVIANRDLCVVESNIFELDDGLLLRCPQIKAFSRTPPHTQTCKQGESKAMINPLAPGYIAIDIETTGLDADTDRIVTISTAEWHADGHVDQHHWFLDPGVAMRKFVSDLIGLSDTFLAGKPSFADIAHGLLNLLHDKTLVEFNAPFDLDFLNHELARAGMDTRIQDHCASIDALEMARARFPGERNNLDALCRRLDIPEAIARADDAVRMAHVYRTLTNIAS